MAFYIFIACFVLFAFFTSMPIAFSMIVATITYCLVADVNLGLVALELFGSLDTFVLLAIPLFILTSEVMNDGSISDRIFDFAQKMVGHIPGGLGLVNIITSIIFSGMSGAAVADVGGIGRLSLNAMTKAGFDEEFSVGVTVASSVIGPIIPPSIPMVILSMVADISIGRLFLGGIMPGLLMGLTLMGYVYIMSIRRNYPLGRRATLREFLIATKRGILSMLTPLILLGGIYSGMFTVTEAAAVAVLYALVLGVFVYRLVGFATFWECLKRVFLITGPILVIFPAARIFGYVLTVENLPQSFASSVMALTSDPWMIILIINLLFLVLGLFSDPNINIMLFVPIVLPLAKSIGMDPVHFGIMVVLNAMIGLTTPPVGQLLIAVSGFVNCSFERIVKGVIPFTLILILNLILIVVFPAIVTWLPNLIYSR